MDRNVGARVQKAPDLLITTFKKKNTSVKVTPTLAEDEVP
jgi:hypothetical protein